MRIPIATISLSRATDISSGPARCWKLGWLVLMPWLAAALTTTSASVPGNSTVKQQAYVNGKALFGSKDFTRAEEVLVAGNKKSPGTPQWHMESGGVLLRLAFDFHTRGDALNSLAAAQRALQHLNTAQLQFGKSDDPSQVANAHEMAGVIHEQLLGNRAAAEASYSAAVALAPRSGQAPVLLARLRASQAEEQRRARK